MHVEDYQGIMRIVRTIFAMLIALGLTLSPVAADLARAHMVKCDHEQMMKDAQMTSDNQVVVADRDDCACCKGAAKCPPASCAAKCANSPVVLASDTGLPRLLRAAFIAVPVAMAHWPTSPPDPPPPRA